MPTFFDKNGWQPNGASVKLACNGTSSNYQFSTNTGNDALNYPPKMRLVVGGAASGATAVFLAFGTDTTIAATSTSGMPLLSNALEVFRAPAGTTYLAYITDAGTANLYFTQGNGD